MRRLGTGFASLLLTVAACQHVHADEIDCGGLANAFGPFDYRTVDRKTLQMVEHYHFSAQVESMRSGLSSYRPVEDISYTLRAFPNHPRALLAMATLAQREKTTKPSGSPYSIACWFDRAIRFQADDGQVRVAYGIALVRDGKRKEAIQQLETAVELLGSDANAYYNLGLAYYDEKDYEKSLDYAKKAYAAGFSLPGLRNKLKQAGKWPE